jgi:hypothetical protein
MDLPLTGPQAVHASHSFYRHVDCAVDHSSEVSSAEGRRPVRMARVRARSGSRSASPQHQAWPPRAEDTPPVPHTDKAKGTSDGQRHRKGPSTSMLTDPNDSRTQHPQLLIDDSPALRYRLMATHKIQLLWWLRENGVTTRHSSYLLTNRHTDIERAEQRTLEYRNKTEHLVIDEVKERLGCGEEDEWLNGLIFSETVATIMMRQRKDLVKEVDTYDVHGRKEKPRLFVVGTEVSVRSHAQVIQAFSGVCVYTCI